MKAVILFLVIFFAAPRMLIPMDEAERLKLVAKGYEPDSSWYRVSYDDMPGVDPPDNFDTRERWPKCIKLPREEGKCAAPGAIAAASAFSDRYCIKAKNVNYTEFSPQYLVSCDKTSQYGCKTSNVNESMWFIKDEGLPTEECVPWAEQESSCPNSCTGKGEFKKRKCTKVIYSSTERDARFELTITGPLTCMFDMYTDFLDYKSGIYYKVSTKLHEAKKAAKLIGYGVENAIHFWVLGFSWGSKWGENGFFRSKIAEANICDIAVACEPDLA